MPSLLTENGYDSLTRTATDAVAGPSRRTVATHVAHILKKLGVATRTDIARETALRIHAGRNRI
jgi:DNA-binding CsgD family transcriptional regulator